MHFSFTVVSGKWQLGFPGRGTGNKVQCILFVLHFAIPMGPLYFSHFSNTNFLLGLSIYKIYHISIYLNGKVRAKWVSS